jgi:hypothetical protein
VPLTELINKLRLAVGQPVTGDSFDDENLVKTYFLKNPD